MQQVPRYDTDNHTALDRWHDLLRQGYRSTAVGGSDDKLGTAYGSASTAIHAEELSVAGVARALRTGRAYVEARGPRHSPRLELETSAIDGEGGGTFGATITGDAAELRVTVGGAAGQQLVLRRDGVEQARADVGDDDWEYGARIEADPGSGPLGTAWTIEARDDTAPTAVGNPVFIRRPATRPETFSSG